MMVDAGLGSSGSFGDGGRPPRVFLSYAHDDAGFGDLVRRFYEFLRVDCGIDAVFDRVAAETPQEWTGWMIRQMREADFVLCVVSPQYRAAAEEELPSDVRRGAQWEARRIRELFYFDEGAARSRVLQVLLPGRDVGDIPSWMNPTSATYYRVEDFTGGGAEKLLRYLTGQPGYREPALGPPVVFGAGRALRLLLSPASPPAGAVQVSLQDGSVELAGCFGRVPTVDPWVALHGGGDQAEVRLAAAAADLGRVVYGGAVAGALAAAVAATPAGSFLELGAVVAEAVGEVAVELAALPDGRWPVLDPVVRFHRPGGVGVAALAGPLKILVAVAAPEETRTANAPLDVEAELQAVMGALAGLDRSGAAQVRVLEVSGLAEIVAALRGDQFHVLHLSGHGDAAGVELEDEDGDAEPVTAAELVAGVRRAGRPLPLVFLSTCRGGAGGSTGMAAGLVAGGVGSVVAMQTAVTDGYATLLAGLFYRELCRRDATPAGALAFARQTLEADRRSQRSGMAPLPEFAVATVLGTAERALVDSAAAPVGLSQVSDVGVGRGPVPELAVGRLIGRRTELRTMLRVLRDDPRSLDAHGARPGVQLLGIGGIGKSALAGRAMARLREEGWAVAAVVGSWAPEALFDAVSSAMARRSLDQEEAGLVEVVAGDGPGLRRLGAVARLLELHRLLVVFDNAEDNLVVGGGGYKDQAFPAALAALAERARRGRLLVTSRYRLPCLDDLLAVPVLPLSRSQVERLLRRLGRLKSLGPADRTMLYRTVGGHPRVLEFVDALLRDGRSDLAAVNAKLRALAAGHDVALSGSDDLDEAVQAALAAGARDIVLPELVALLNDEDREVLLQLSVSSLPMSTVSLAAALGGDAPQVIAAGLDRLVDMSLVSPLGNDLFGVHRWTAQALRAAEPDDPAWRDRFRRAGEERLRLVNAGRGGLADVAEAARNYTGAGDTDTAVSLIGQVAGMDLAAMTKAAFLGDVLPLVPDNHDMYAFVVDAEAQALLDLGFGPQALDRYRTLLARHEQLAATDTTNTGFQRDLSISYERLGDIASNAGQAGDALKFFQESLALWRRLASMSPDVVDYRFAQRIPLSRLAALLATQDVDAAARHLGEALAILSDIIRTDANNTAARNAMKSAILQAVDLRTTASGTATTALIKALDEQIIDARHLLGDAE